MKRSSLSFIMPHDGKRAIVRCRDDHYLHPFRSSTSRLPRAASRRPPVGRRAALCQACREAGILTSLDGGGLRSNTHELLEFIDVADRRRAAVRADGHVERRDAGLSEEKRLPDRRRHARRARHALVRRDGAVRQLPALPIPRERVIDTNGAGDLFHGAYVYSYLTQPEQKLGRPFPSSRAPPPPSSPASRQRGGTADADGHRSGQDGVQMSRK